MANTLATITKLCGVTNTEGLQKFIHIALEEEVTSIPSPDSGTYTVSTAITMVATKLFYKWAISGADQKFDVNVEGDEDSSARVTDAEFFIPQLSSVKSYILATNSDACPLIVALDDMNGNTRLVGEVGNGCYIKAKEQVTPKPGYVCTLRHKSTHPPLYYESTLTTA